MQKNAKKFLPLFILLLGLLFTFNSSPVAALTSDQINSIMTLLKAFGAEQSVITNVQSALTGGGGGGGGGGTTWCYTFKNDLTVGNSGEGVRALDTILQKEGVGQAASFEGQASTLISDDGVFIERTAEAVVQFQAKYGIRQTGYVGPITRAKLNSLYGCKVSLPTSTTQLPIIDSVKGPTNLGDGEIGSWTIYAHNPDGSALTYGVIWGDEVDYKNVYGGMPLSAIQYQNNPVFTHKYYKVASTGTTWTPAFFVRNAQGKDTRLGYPVNVGFASAQPSATITTSAQTTNTMPYIIGTASGVNQVGITISNSGGKVYGSGLIPVVNSNWSVTISPALALGQYTINVYDANNNLLTTSPLNIISSVSTQPSITVLSPNGGETWQAGSVQNIRWSSSSTIASVNIWLLDELGQTLFIIANTQNSGSYSWNIPSDYPFNGKKFKMYICDNSAGGQCTEIRDWSNSIFIITAPSTQPSITITSPSAGENWYFGTTQTIRWQSSGVSKVSLWNCSPDNVCSRFSSIPTTGITNTGSYSVVPEQTLHSGTIKIRVASEDNYPISTVRADSGLFNVVPAPATQPSITVLSPNGGEKLAAGQSYLVKWNTQNFGNLTISLDLAKYNEAGQQSLTNIVYNIPNTGSYAWTVPTMNDMNVPNMKLLASSFDKGPSAQDYSDNYFTITTISNLPPVVDGVSGPTSLKVNETGTWSIKAHDPENGALSYSVDWGDTPTISPTGGGANAPMLGAAQQTSSFTHSYSSAGTYTVQFKVTDDKGLTAQSSISVSVSSSTSVPVKIVDGTTYGSQGDAFVRLSILGSAANKGVHHWVLGYTCQLGVTLDTGSDFGKPALCNGTTVGKSAQTYYAYNIADVTRDYLMITAGAKNGTQGVVDIPFVLEARDNADRTIGRDTKTVILQPANTASITVLSPNGGEVWQIGSTQTITWSNNPSGKTVPIYVLQKRNTNGIEQFWNVYTIDTYTPKTGSFSWTVPSSLAVGDNYYIQVGCWSYGFAPTDSCNGDISDSPFTIGPKAVPIYPVLSVSLLDTSTDYAGAWGQFAPGTGNVNKNPADWHWVAALNLPSQKTISRITIIHNTRGEVWSTGYSRFLKDGTDLYGYEEHPYPIVAVLGNTQMNNAYDQTISLGTGSSFFLQLYGQREATTFTGGKLVMEFTDGTNATATIPAGSAATQPSITFLSPNSGPINTPVKISGSNFTVRGNEVSFNCPSIGASAGALDVASVEGRVIITNVPPMPAYSALPSLPYPLNCNVSVKNTNGASNNLAFTITSSSNLPPVVDGVSGPTALKVNETGTWSIKAHDPENGPLSYSVDWGDTPTISPTGGGANAPILGAAQQTSTFTHSYSSAGTYTIQFKVTDDKGQMAQSSITVQVLPSTQAITLNPNTDNWFSSGAGGLTFAELSSGGFPESSSRFIRVAELFTFVNTPPGRTESAAATYYRYQGAWYKYGDLSAINDGTNVPSTYFTIRYNGSSPVTINIPTSVKFYGSTAINPSQRPWDPQPSLTVLSPNGGESWAVGSAQNVQYRATGLEGKNVVVSLVRYDSAASTNNSGIGPIATTPSLSGTAVTVPVSWRSGNYNKIKVCAGQIDYPYSCAAEDYSDGFIAITANNPLTNGEVLARLEWAIMNNLASALATPAGSPRFDFDVNGDGNVDVSDPLTVRNMANLSEANFIKVRDKIVAAIMKRAGTPSSSSAYDVNLDFTLDGEIGAGDVLKAQNAMNAVHPMTTTSSELNPEAVSAIAEFSQKKNLNLAAVLAAIAQLIEAFK